MFNRFKRALAATNGFLIELGRIRAWSELRMMSDATLQRMGLAPELVRRGPHQWPWRDDAAAIAQRSPSNAAKPAQGPQAEVVALAPHDRAA